MGTTATTMFYSAPLTPGGREDNWHYDAATNPPNVIPNFLTVEKKIEVRDARTEKEFELTIDTCGFQKYDFPTQVNQKSFMNRDADSIKAYVQETENFLKGTLGASQVLHFDTCIRQKNTEAPVKASSDPFVGPFQRVHVDQNPASAQARLEHHLGSEYKTRRFQIINVWRAFVEPVKNYPLALLDYRSLDPYSDLVITRRVLPDWMHEQWVQDREGYSLKHHEGHRWYQWSSLTPDEVVLFKCHDSASESLILSHSNAVSKELSANEKPNLDPSPEATTHSDNALKDIAGVCPHTAFYDDQSPTSGHLRSSADLRFIVLYD